jgi:hydroxymethylpyrimidine pyrophosphatase-like HAD family hydrolase
LKPDYFIAWSGALIGDSSGNILWVNPFSEEEKMEMNDLRKKIVPIYYKNLVLQYMCSSEEINYLPKSTYHEIYGDKVYISKSTNAKTSAIVRLLQHIKWKGDVVAFGDRHYDMEFLKYFDGTFIQYPITNKLQIKQKEIVEENG